MSMIGTSMLGSEDTEAISERRNSWGRTHAKRAD
jgi:hypothetical protein